MPTRVGRNDFDFVFSFVLQNTRITIHRPCDSRHRRKRSNRMVFQYFTQFVRRQYHAKSRDNHTMSREKQFIIVFYFVYRRYCHCAPYFNPNHSYENFQSTFYRISTHVIMILLLLLLLQCILCCRTSIYIFTLELDKLENTNHCQVPNVFLL